MKLSVLGCSGGIGGDARRTTSFLIDDDILLDCGTGVGDLPLEALARIDHVFLTHAHFDHVAFLPLLADSVSELRRAPIMVHGLAGTLDALRAHVFNGTMWPDFTVLPKHAPALSLRPVEVGACIDVGGRRLTALPAFHSVPALAWCLDSGDGRLVFSGDTRFDYGFVAALNALGPVNHLLVETAFADEQAQLARDSSHLCPQSLRRLLDAVEGNPQVHLSHLKPGLESRIARQIDLGMGRLRPTVLQRGDVLEF
ncbi:MAG: 3',5'-cyclic-nucleotide phosphodiesterase [Pseudazoarcus pumilus]|nr:3',5'-cyclic-nucleotide phosphodiesterase [Pseudazoarcus pumilus]